VRDALARVRANARRAVVVAANLPGLAGAVDRAEQRGYLVQAVTANPAAALQMVNTREVDVVVAASLDDLPQVEIRSGAAGAAGTDPADRVGDEGHAAPAAAGRPRPGGGRGPRSDHRPAGRVAERSSGARAG
jgi:hypothetical protein